jgi:UDP-N-acetylmuramoyl-L-alanyl-D-glutamate--2,6-diaminopimelate ligase
VSAIVEASGGVSAVVGTLGARVGEVRLPLERTTPEASDFQRLLARMVDGGATIATCEVSSHALELGRVTGTRFAVAAFTNLSQDHLDFHGDMERYFRAKARLFESGVAGRAVIWTDDPWGARLAGEVRVPSTTVGFEPPAEIRPEVLSAGFSGSRIRLALPDATALELHLPIAGRFSVANAAVAAGCALSLGMPRAAVVEGLEGLSQIPGRFELVSGDGPIAVVVDYSHTPAGIEAAIATAREIAPGRVVAVVGAGGDRDRSKRPQMGRAAAEADIVVVTTDNPRSERPGAIIEEIVEGMTGPHEAIVDRREAIARAIALAVPGDAVLVMGKGHEPYQEVMGERLPFDDRIVAREILAARGDAS